MTTLQKVIKYSAIGFAIFLISVIVNAIIGGIQIITEGFGFINKVESNEDENFSTYIKYEEDISYLDINLTGSNLIIKPGEELSVKANDKTIKISNEGNKLKIVDKNKRIIGNKIKDLIIVIPKDLMFDKVSISAGAGNVNVNGINSNSLNMELGAGKVTLKNIYSNKTKIETGAGNVDIKDSSLNDLNLELGVGKISISANITGISSIESGIGAFDLKLNGSASMYKFDIEKGIGEIIVNEEKITSNKVIGEGDNSIKIEGGIGSIKISTIEE